MADPDRRPGLIRIGQLLLVVAAIVLWVASRLPWVVLESADGLGQPRTTTLSWATWSTALVPVALLLVAAAVATLAVRGWPLRAVAVLLAAASAATAYLAISQWVVPEVAARAADLAEVPVIDLVGSQRQYAGAVLTLVAAVSTLVAAVLMIRAATGGRTGAGRYAAPGARRAAVRADPGTPPGSDPASPDAEPADPSMSERMIWDALDEGHDPTERDSDAGGGPPAEGR